jgi:four helix bundle protein
METRFRFEKLEVWQDARKINQSIYRLTRKFPREELFAMTSQIRRAAISISSNIAEGSGRNSDKDFAHFLEQAYGSLMEVASIFYLAFDEGYVKESDLESLFDELEKLAKRTASLNRSLFVPTSKTPFSRAMSPALDPRPSTLD